MFGSNLLDVALGLTFVYLLFSLLVTVVNELIATYTRMRAKNLEAAISRMVFTGDFKNKFYEHPLIKSLVKKDGKAPSYIEAKTFAKVVTDVIQVNGDVRNLAEGKVSTSLSDAIKDFRAKNVVAAIPAKKVLFWTRSEIKPPPSTDMDLLIEFSNDAANNVGDFNKKLEEWFNQTMDRVSGWYQRRIKLITLGIGILITILFNVDSINIYKILSTNNKVRGEVIVAAAGYLEQQNKYQLDPDAGSVTAEKLEELLCKQIDPAVNILGIGWPHDSLNDNLRTINWLTAPLGWILTIIAISLGAPFWFDLLSKAMNLRGTGTQVSTKSQSQQL